MRRFSGGVSVVKLKWLGDCRCWWKSRLLVGVRVYGSCGGRGRRGVGWMISVCIVVGCYWRYFYLGSELVVVFFFYFL